MTSRLTQWVLLSLFTATPAALADPPATPAAQPAPLDDTAPRTDRGRCDPDSVDTSWSKTEACVSGGAAMMDQDFFGPLANSDRNYTMGLGLRISGAFLEHYLVSRPLEFLDALSALSKWHDDLTFASPGEGFAETFQRSHTLTLAGNGFTPDDLIATEPVLDDRPYASLIALEVARTTIDLYNRQVLRTAFTLGVLGTEVSRIMQSEIHRQGLRNDPNYRPIPLGWHNQISHGGEPTALYSVSYWRELSPQNHLPEAARFLARYYDLTLQTDGSLGYYTNVSAGLLLRLGLLQSDFWQFAGSPLGIVSQGAETQDVRRRNRAAFELYGYAQLRSRLVLYNALLQGQFRESAHTLRADEISRVVNEFEFGATAGICGFSATAAIISGRTPEHLLAQQRTHVWGGVYLTYQHRRPGTRGFCGER